MADALLLFGFYASQAKRERKQAVIDQVKKLHEQGNSIFHAQLKQFIGE